MTLLEVRQQFRILSGRYDLVDQAGVDQGADFHIRAGQKYLDRLIETYRSPGRVFRILHAGDYYVTFQQCRSVQEVYCFISEEGRWQLTKKDMADFRLAFYDMWPSLDTGNPLYYTPAVLRAVPETDRMGIEDFDALVGVTDIMVGESYLYNGILIGPPVEQDTHVEVWGYFYSDDLSSDDHKSFWTENYPDVLIMAAMRSTEIFNRNTQGVNDWTNAINQEVDGIDKDLVAQSQAEVTQMEG